MCIRWLHGGGWGEGAGASVNLYTFAHVLIIILPSLAKTVIVRHSNQDQYNTYSRVPMPFLWGCSYLTVDSAMDASQNGFFSYKLFIHKKTNIMQIMKKY